jgi:hypothetical protein
MLVMSIPVMKFEQNPSEVCCNVFLREDGYSEKMLPHFLIRSVKAAEEVFNELSLHVGV